MAELYLVWHVSHWGQNILCTESSMGVIRHLSFRFCIYSKPEGFKKGYKFSIVFRVTCFFLKKPHLLSLTLHKTPNLSKRPTPHLGNGVMKLFALIHSTAHKMAVQYCNKMLNMLFPMCGRTRKMYVDAVAD